MGEVVPCGFYGCGEGGGPRDIDAHVLRGNGFSGCSLEIRGEAPVAGQEAAVYCGHGGEECDFWFGGFDAICVATRAAVGAVGVVCGKIWGSEALPYGVCVERKHELDGGTGKKGRDDGVDGSMDVVQRQDVEEVV